MLYFDASRANFEAARAAVRSTVNALRTGTVSAAEVERARRKLLASALRTQASPDGVLDMLENAAEEHRTPDDYATLAALYGKVTASDVERAARAHLHPDRMIEFDEGVGVRERPTPPPD